MNDQPYRVNVGNTSGKWEKDNDSYDTANEYFWVSGPNVCTPVELSLSKVHRLCDWLNAAYCAGEQAKADAK